MDIGTASVSAAIARLAEGKTPEIIGVFREPFSLFSFESIIDRDKKALNTITAALRSVFEKAKSAMPHPDEILISLSEPFFQERILTKQWVRKSPDLAISEAELKLQIASPFGDAISESAKLLCFSQIILSAAVNGYSVATPIGYRGKQAEIVISGMFMSSLLKERIDDATHYHFPKINVRFFADPYVLREAVSKMRDILYPALIIDTGGEITGISFCKESKSCFLLRPVFIGVRTIERKLASSLNSSISHSESLLRRLVAGTLDASESSKIGASARFVASEWWQKIGSSIEESALPGASSIVLGGQGRDLPFFSECILQNSANPPKIILLASPLGDTVPRGALSSGSDIVLASLLSFSL